MDNPHYTPDLPSTLITDVSMAHEMADAAQPGYEALRKGGRNLTINQAAAIGMEIGAAMEVARHNYLADTVGMTVVAESAEVTPVIQEPTVAYDPAEVTQQLVEQNIAMLSQTISSIFTTLRQADGKLAFGHTHTSPIDGVATTYESVTMYDPKTRTIARIYQNSRAVQGALEPYDQQIDENVPVEGTQVAKKGRRVKAQGRALALGQSYRIEDGKNASLHAIHDTTINTNPDDLSALLTRLTRSFPLSDPHCVLARDSIKGHREPLLDKDLARKLNADQQRYHELQNTIPGELPVSL
jgi:hypothetical protein